jgi:hypothetical protein
MITPPKMGGRTPPTPPPGSGSVSDCEIKSPRREI